MFKNCLFCIIIINGDYMQEIIDFVNSFINNSVYYLQSYGILFGCFLVLLESIIPALPLGVFIAFNMMAFGNITGFIISWISTCIGCTLSYLLFSKTLGKKLQKKAESNPKIKKLKSRIKKIKFSNLVLIIALPFTPAFLINIVCGLSKMEFKKFISAILIGKLSIVFFWGFISKSLIESITDIKTMIIILGLLFICYLGSKVINKKLNIE